VSPSGALDAGAPNAAPAPRIAVLDYGMGNIRSAEKALLRLGARAQITSDIERARGADGLVLPGDGAFPKAVAGIRALGLDRVVADCAARGVPTLGICIGMQVLFEGSEELGGAEGLGVLAGRVRALEAPGLKLPHIGWAPVEWRRASPLCAGLGPSTTLFHVHSFAPDPADPEDVVGVAEHGRPFCSAVERGAVWGVQFHPEKSSVDGLALLANFVARCAAGTGAESPRADAVAGPEGDATRRQPSAA
jgi:glutamine amidotransferase